MRTGAKDFSPAKAITQLLAAGGNNRQVIIEARDTELDVNAGFAYVRLSITVGTAHSVLAASCDRVSLSEAQLALPPDSAVVLSEP